MARLAIALVSVTLTAATAAGQPAPAPEPAPVCKVASDAGYGYRPDRPVQVGGSPVYGAARQRRYLDALRGPGGEPLTYERTGSLQGPDRDTLVDSYVVRYEGLDKPLTLFLDWYHFTEPMAPAGLRCGTPLERALGLPPPDPFQGEEQLAALAAATAAAATGPTAPIPLGPDAADGFVLDRFRVVARRAPPGATVPKPHRTIVVIRAVACDGRRVTPTAIQFASRNGQIAEPIETFTVATRFAALQTGIEVPDGSLGAVFQVDGVANGIDVRATFSGRGCRDEPATRTWPMVVTPAALAASAMPARPAGDRSGAPFVAVQAFIDVGGTFREARALGGPEALVRAALDAVAGWRVTPATANGAPLATPVVLMVRFTDPPPGRR